MPICKCFRCIAEDPDGKQLPYSLLDAHKRRERRERSKRSRLGSDAPHSTPIDSPQALQVQESAPPAPSFYDDDPVPISYDDDNDALDATYGAVTPDDLDSDEDQEDDRFVPSLEMIERAHNPAILALEEAMKQARLDSQREESDADLDSEPVASESGEEFEERRETSPPAQHHATHIAPLSLTPEPSPELSNRSMNPIPLHYCHVPEVDENSPDPFHRVERDSPRDVDTLPLDVVHPHPAVQILYLLVAWLHSQAHVSLVIISAILFVIKQIMQCLGLALDTTIAETYKTVQKHMGTEPLFAKLPVCPQCLEVYPSSDDLPENCGVCNTELFDTSKSRKGKERKRRGKPLKQFPYMPIKDQLPGILAQPGVEKMLDQWRTKSRETGVYRDIFDGAVAREVKAHNGRPFFQNLAMDECGPEGELRIGLTLGADWFSYHRSNGAASHTSGPMSFCVANLPPRYRYRTANLMLSSILPGPKEQDFDEIQRFMRPMVNELLDLWKNGIQIATPSCAPGQTRKVRVILLGIICDTPAAHKLGGFGAHSHRCFCTQCWATQENLRNADAFVNGAFPARTNEQQREYADQYRQLKNKSQRKTFMQQYASRWTELARLPYFDLVRMVVIDPMHNLFLGLVKTHFYHIWVQEKILRKTKELRRLHELLKNFVAPTYLATLPSLIGEPAGGSLTSDQWHLLATVFGPIVIPLIWKEFLPSDEAGQAAARSYRQESVALKREKAIKMKEHKEQLKAQKKAEKEAKKAKDKADKSTLKAAAAAEKTIQGSVAQAEMEVRASDESISHQLYGDRTASIPVSLQASPSQSTASNQKSASAHPVPPKPKSKKRKANAIDEDDDDEPIQPQLSPDDVTNFLYLSQSIQFWLRRTITEDDIAKGSDQMEMYLKGLAELYGNDVYRPNHHYAVHTPDFIRDYGPLYGFWTFLFERLNKVLKSFHTNNHAGGELEVTFFREFHRAGLVSRMLFQAYLVDNQYVRSSADRMIKATADERGTVQGLARELDEAVADEGLPFYSSPNPQYAVLPSNVYSAILAELQKDMPYLRSHINISEANQTTGSRPLTPRAYYHDFVVVDGRRYNAAARSSTTKNSLLRMRKDGISEVCKLVDIVKMEGDGLNELLLVTQVFSELMVMEETAWDSIWHHGISVLECQPGAEYTIIRPNQIQTHVASLSTSLGSGPALVTINLAAPR